MEFPGPRATPAMAELVVERLSTGPLPAWSPVRAARLELSWIGVACPELGLDRAWVWDVVTPELRREHQVLRQDPLVLAVEHDLVICHLLDTERGESLHLPIPVRAVPDSLRLPTGAIPPAPYELSLDAGWSKEAIEAGIDAWAGVECGTTVCVSGEPAIEGWEVGEGLRATDAAFEALLALEPRDAGAALEAFSAVLEALEDVLDLGDE